MGFTEKKIKIYDEFSSSNYISQNLLSNSWWTKGLINWERGYGEVTIDEDEHGFMNLIVNSTDDSQVHQKVSLSENHCYFIMFDVKATRYVNGLFGVHINGRFISGNQSFGVRRQTKNKDFETVYGVLKTGNFPTQDYDFVVGSVGKANVSGSIRKLSVYDLTEIYGCGKEPTAKDFFDVLPENQDDLGIYSSSHQIFAALDTKINSLSRRIEVLDRDAHRVFIEEMNNKARLLGMDNTVFKNMHGFKADGQVSTAKDFLKLGFYAIGNAELIKVWGAKEYNLLISSEKNKNLKIETTLHSSYLEEKYMVLGGKTGTIGRDVLDVITLVADKDENLYLAVVMGASGKTGGADRFEGVDQLISAYKKKYVESVNPITLFKATSGSVMKIPSGNPYFYTNTVLDATFGVNETEIVVPASMPKLMTALLLIENVNNLNETGFISHSDIAGGSGPKLVSGDRISFRDALYLLLLPSSNTAAKFISREVGNRIIQSRGYVS